MMKVSLFVVVAAFATLSAVIAAPQSGGSGGLDPSNLSDQQKQNLSNQLKQQLQQIGFDVSQLPMDSNGNIDLSKLPRDSNGNIELSQIVNGSGGSNGSGGGGSNGGVNVSGGGGSNGGGLNVNGGGGSNGGGNGGQNGGGNSGPNVLDLSPGQTAQISMELEKYLDSIGFDVSQLPRDSNGNIALMQLPHDSNGHLEINEIVNGEGGSNGGGANGNVNIGGNGGGKVNGGANIRGNGGGSGACNNGRKIPATGNVNGFRCLDDKDYYIGKKPLSIFDLEKTLCQGGIQYAEGGIINGTQIGLNMISDGAARLLKGIAGKKGNPGSANLFDRAANQADITLNTFIDRAGDATRTFFCGITETVHKLLKGIKDGKPLGGLSAAAIFFLKGALRFFGYDLGGGALQTVEKAVTGVGRILGLGR